MAGGTLITKSTVFAMRAFSSAKVCSVSSYFGISMPARRAIAPLAVSVAIWICRLSGNMSGNRRNEVSASGSIFFASQCACALSSRPERLFRMFAKRGALA